ncbi:Eco29kI family restriction endonuclease [Streptomyces sp. H27-H1]|uniref:Eco29kI family restriction endonuclease n=1 Tax=Streptomyces sp. H27-H1 TaxID=2996461 RepID=UPI00226FFF8B|nr:Eco29kI family restriction endonuclease [Streptomyces sp. H27-H1]MCY0927051.1 Eco29kI family restriction endonuclease [Streptomyces sp. H27-H1]
MKKWAEAAERFEPFNPLDLDNLGRSVEGELLERPAEPLGQVPHTFGAGVYAIYFTGAHELYTPISSEDCKVPIYVGQARPQGTRKGSEDPTKETTTLWDRIEEHKDSITAVHDLDISDFRVRYLVAIEAFVSLTERVMIRKYRPVWNRVVDGFGNHDPGADRRKSGKRPAWDELHPGRWWSHPLNMPTDSLTPADVSRDRIRALFAGELSEAEIESIESGAADEATA